MKLISYFFRVEETDNHKVIYFCGIKFKFYIEQKHRTMQKTNDLDASYYDEIIPIGDNCLPAFILKELNLRKASYPFDWVYSKQEFFPIAADIIINKYKNFFNLCDLKCMYIDNKHNNLVYINKKTKLVFMHDFIVGQYFIIQYFALLKKYMRRIKKVKKTLSKEKILLLNIQQNKTEDKVLVEKLKQIRKVYNNNNIDLLVLQNDNTKDEKEYEVQILTPDIKKILYNNDENFSPVKDEPWFRNKKMSLKLIQKYCTINNNSDNNIMQKERK